MSCTEGGEELKPTLRNKIDHFFRKRRKGLTRLSPALTEIAPLLELAVTRPVNIFKMSEHYVNCSNTDDLYLEKIHRAIEELLRSRKTSEEAANVCVSVLRGLKSTDIGKAISFGEKYVPLLNDERAIRTLLSLYVDTNQRQKAINLIEQSDNLPWVNRTKLSLLGPLVHSMSREEHFMRFQGISYADTFEENILLLYADVNMNVIDGSSIWLASITEAFANFDGRIHLLLKANITRNTVLKPLIENSKIKIFEPLEFGISDGELNPEHAIKLIEMMDGIYGGYKRIVLRGFNLCKVASSTKSLHGRIWAYLTDYYEIDNISGKRRDKQGVGDLIPDFVEHFDRFLAQTEEIRDDLMQRHFVPPEMFNLVPPMIPLPVHAEASRNETTSTTIKIGYAGKIAPEWGVRELIGIASRAHERNLKIEVHIIGDKIHRNTPAYPSFHEDIRSLLENDKHTVWHGGLNRQDTLELMSSMDLCWGYRSKLLEDNTLELSTKTLEYLSLGLPTLISRNSINERICGHEYPFFIDTNNDVFEQAIEIIEQTMESPPTPQKLQNLVENFTITKVWGEFLLPLVQSIERSLRGERKKILINGHDLKFISEFESHLKKLGHDVRRDRWEWGEPQSLIRSEAMAPWANIVFSEWGLANAAWYSQHISHDQSHFVRVHLQEINARARRFPPNIHLDHVEKIIFVSERVKTVAMDMFQWPAEKCVVVHNYVNVELFDAGKHPKAEFTLAIVGIVPQRKRLDRALDLLRSLRMNDKRWNLIIKGKLPHDYAFMHADGRKEELVYYEDQYERIKTDHFLRDAVSFESYTPSLASWYRGVGYILSPSDFESFHYSIAEGAASGSVPLIWPWDGVEEFYPESWVGDTHTDLIKMASDLSKKDPRKIEINKKLIHEKYSMDLIFSRFEGLMNIDIE